MTGQNKKGAYMTKEDMKADIIAGIKKYLEIGAYNMIYLREKELMDEYGMTAAEIEDAIYN